jgi:tetratricopeptide (TPR) repeat protein
MDTGLTQPTHGTRLKRELSREAISLALNGDWERATEVNRAILELFADDVEAMNRLGKALMELSRYGEARDVLGRVAQIAPYNAIAKKNLARLSSLETSPVANRQVRKVGGAPQLFIEESGKSGTTVLRKMAEGPTVARIAPSDPATLVVENNSVNVHSKDGDYLGQIEPKLGQRLARLMCGGNKYDAAIVRVNEQGIAVIIRETYRHRSLASVCSFPSKTKEEHRVYLGESLVRYIRDEDLEDDDEEESIIDEEEIETEWGDNE